MIIRRKGNKDSIKVMKDSILRKGIAASVYNRVIQNRKIN